MKKRVLLIATLIMGAVSMGVYAQSETATNCYYTGNSSDYCYASDGTHNLKVINCTPGSTECYYDKP